MLKEFDPIPCFALGPLNPIPLISEKEDWDSYFAGARNRKQILPPLSLKYQLLIYTLVYMNNYQHVTVTVLIA